MLEIRRHADLGEEPVGAEHGAQLGVQEFHRHAALMLEVAGEINGGHSAGADLALYLISTSKSDLELRLEGVHSANLRLGSAEASARSRPPARDHHNIGRGACAPHDDETAVGC